MNKQLTSISAWMLAALVASFFSTLNLHGSTNTVAPPYYSYNTQLGVGLTGLGGEFTWRFMDHLGAGIGASGATYSMASNWWSIWKKAAARLSGRCGHRQELHRFLFLLRLDARRVQSSLFRFPGGAGGFAGGGQGQSGQFGCLFGPYATFVETFARVMGLPPLDRYFFIDGGALAVENALKAAMDWKVRKNMAAGRGERGTEILHFTARLSRPQRLHHEPDQYRPAQNRSVRQISLAARQRPVPRFFPAGKRAAAKRVIEKEKLAEAQIRRSSPSAARHRRHHHRTIQGEGGDNHFRGEWLQTCCAAFATRTTCF
jgi:hypothetical protein